MSWFVGLYEGDGTLITHSKGFTFNIVSNHKATLIYIQKTLGFGNINKTSLGDKWVYIVESRFHIYLILLILNGNLVLTRRFNNFLNVAEQFNSRPFKGKPFPHLISILPYGTIPSLNDGWLSGFVDAEGHFGLPVESKRKSVSHYISITFEIGQNGERWLFILLNQLFNGGVVYPPKEAWCRHNRIIFKGVKSGANPVTLVFNYFDQFPLFTKADIYTEWRSIHKSLLAKEHLDPSKLPSLVSRCITLNDKINNL